MLAPRVTLDSKLAQRRHRKRDPKVSNIHDAASKMVTTQYASVVETDATQKI